MAQPKTASKFTPGPWSRIRAYEDKPQLFDLVGGHPATTIVASDVHSSNVRLIAKAPEMYELLKKIFFANQRYSAEGLGNFGPPVPTDWNAIKETARRIKAEIDGEG